MAALRIPKITPAMGILLAACAVFLLSPYLPSAVLDLVVGNRVGAFVVIFGNLYLLRQDYVLGLGVFIAACGLFLENRRRKVAKIIDTKTHAGAPVEVLSRPAPDLVPGEIHPRREEPSVEDVGYEPSEQESTLGEKAFGSSSAVENEKGPLETMPSNASEEVVSFLESKGLA